MCCNSQRRFASTDSVVAWNVTWELCGFRICRVVFAETAAIATNSAAELLVDVFPNAAALGAPKSVERVSVS